MLQKSNIKKGKNRESKIKQTGALVLDLGVRSLNAVAKAIGSCWRFVKFCYVIVRDNLQIVNKKHNCGRKKKTEEYPNLEVIYIK